MIREYNQKDLEDVLKIWLESSLVAHNFIEESYWASKIDDMRHVYIPSSKTYVYLDDETYEILGFASMVNNYLAAIFVRPSHWGKGIGRILMNKIKEDYPKIELNVYSENTRSVSFYEKQGFVILEEKIEENTEHRELHMVFEIDDAES